MNLDFSDDQKFLQSEARKFLEKEGSLGRNRDVLDEKISLDNELWDKIISMGWTGIRIPEEYDGLGLGHLELCVVAEELGRALAPVPFSSSVYLFTETIIKYADEDLKKIFYLSLFQENVLEHLRLPRICLLLLRVI